MAINLTALSNDELVDLLTGTPRFWPGVEEISRPLGYSSHPHRAAMPSPGSQLAAHVPFPQETGIRFVDGPRGIVLPGGTTFPCSMARGATWDTALERRIGTAIGRETVRAGGNFFGGVCINLCRHPAWGRAQETYGEDSVLLGAMGAALASGVQSDGQCMACVKHFALNSMENMRFEVDVTIGERALHEVYLPHFEHVVKEANVASVMSAYNSVNGAFMSRNRALLADVLRGAWGFQGFVMSDFVFGTRGNAKDCLLAGLDVDMPFQAKYRRHLAAAAAVDADVREALVQAATRVATQIARFTPPSSSSAAPNVDAAEHAALALEAARKSIVLLKNDDDVLPLLGTGARIHVVGRLAHMVNLGDRGSSNTRPSGSVSTPLQALRRRFANVTYRVDADAAQIADAAVTLVFVGRTWRDEGEFVKPVVTPALARDCIPAPGLSDLPALAKLAAAQLRETLLGASAMHDGRDGGFGVGGDLEYLGLAHDQVRLIVECAAASRRVVVVLQAGSCVMVEGWIDRVAGVVMAWYGGEQGADALADVLAGATNPSGKMPVATPRRMDHLVRFDRTARAVEYGLFDHGQVHLDRCGHRARFPLGFGLSYTRFELRLLAVRSSDEAVVHVDVEAANAGSRSGAEVVMAFVHATASKVERAVALLKAFQRVELQAGERVTVTLSVPMRAFAHFEQGRFVVDEGAEFWLSVNDCAGEPLAGAKAAGRAALVDFTPAAKPF